jgi:hypothetical protein
MLNVIWSVIFPEGQYAVFLFCALSVNCLCWVTFKLSVILLNVIYAVYQYVVCHFAQCHLCWVAFMLNVIWSVIFPEHQYAVLLCCLLLMVGIVCAEWHLSWLSFILSVILLSVIYAVCQYAKCRYDDCPLCWMPYGVSFFLSVNMPSCYAVCC